MEGEGEAEGRLLIPLISGGRRGGAEVGGGHESDGDGKAARYIASTLWCTMYFVCSSSGTQAPADGDPAFGRAFQPPGSGSHLGETTAGQFRARGTAQRSRRADDACPALPTSVLPMYSYLFTTIPVLWGASISYFLSVRLIYCSRTALVLGK